MNTNLVELIRLQHDRDNLMIERNALQRQVAALEVENKRLSARAERAAKLLARLADIQQVRDTIARYFDEQKATNEAGR